METRQLDPYDDRSNRRVWEVERASDAHGRPWALPVPWEAARVSMVPNESRGLLSHGAFVGDRLVGVASCGLPLLDNTQSASLSVHVLPDERRRSYGSTLLERALADLEGAGRRVVQGEVNTPSVGEEAPGVAFVAAHGFSLGIANDHRVVDLRATADRWPRLREECAPHHVGYRFATWNDVVPAELLDGYCELQHAFNTEAPAGELEVEAEHWDEERVRAREERFRRAGRHEVVTVAIAADGSVAGLSEVMVSAHDPGYGFQGGTLVLPRHRGHRLGLVLKLVNQRAVAERFPGCATLHTWNAGINEHMNGLNDRLGFTSVERLLEMQRRI